MRKIQRLLRARSPPCLWKEQPETVKAPASRCKAVSDHPTGLGGIRTPPAPQNAALAPRVARCGQTWRSPLDWGCAGRQNYPKSTRHFFARFLGQCRRSILQLDKGRWSLCALPPGNTAPQRGSVLRWRWSVFSLLAVRGGRNPQKSKDMPITGRFPRWSFWVVYQNSGGRNVPKYKHSC